MKVWLFKLYSFSKFLEAGESRYYKYLGYQFIYYKIIYKGRIY